MDVEGFWKECPRCNGKGTEIEITGIFSQEKREIICTFCKGHKKIFFTTTCPLMTSIQFKGDSRYETSFLNKECIGIRCTLWDRDSNEGGCLWRKSLLKQLL
jgi:hypothetical protein